MRHWLVFVLFLLGLGTLRVVACGEDDACVNDEDCDDGNPCTSDWCLSYEDPAALLVRGCRHSAEDDGTPCGSGKVCVDGECRENICEGVVCDDGDPCTDDLCDYADGTCDSAPVDCDDGNDCTENACDPVVGCITTPGEDGTICSVGSPERVQETGECAAGSCLGPCDPESDEVLQCPLEGFALVCCPGSEYCTPDCNSEERP